MASYTDQTGRKIILAETPLRIVSTVPSQTELLYDLGLGKNVVGITAYCVHPRHWIREKTVIGGTKDLQIEKIRSLRPDLVIGNKEENIKEQIEELALDFPVWLSDIKTVDDALGMIREVTKMCGKSDSGEELYKQIFFWRSKLQCKEKISRKVAYFIWKKPYMLAGPDTFISAMLRECGLHNIMDNPSPRYPEVSMEELKQLDPDVILLGSEPYAFNASDVHEWANFLPDTKCRVVDGELFSWYGSRMITAFKYFYMVF